jgi:hypothetical protein
MTVQRTIAFALAAASLALGGGVALTNRLSAQGAPLSAAPVLDWSHEAQRAIVPPGPNGVFGPENYGNKFPGEAAVYMGIVHAAMYDTAVAIEGGYQPYAAIGINASPDTSPAAAIATAVHHTLVGSPDIGMPGLQPALGLSAAQQAILDGDYVAYLNAIPDGSAKANGVWLGQQIAVAILQARLNDGRDKNPSLADLKPPPPAPGVWQPNMPASKILGLNLPGIRPLALASASQFRPGGPNSLTSVEYAEDFNQVKDLGRFDSASRTPEQTQEALFWTDHDLRQWNDGMLNLAAARGLDLVQAARMLAMAHVSGGDAMIACFDAKYFFWFWRPWLAIPQADTDGNAATISDPTWRPLGATPNFPEFPSAHACHSTAVAEALGDFFGTDKITFSLYSRITQTTRTYRSFSDVFKEVDLARVLVGFHFRNSDQQGTTLGRKVGRYVADHFFQPTN